MLWVSCIEVLPQALTTHIGDDLTRSIEGSFCLASLLSCCLDLSRKEILKYATEHLRIDSDLLIVGGRLIRREVELIEVSIESIKKSLWKCESRCNPVISIRLWIKESSIEVWSIAIERISLSYRSIEALEEEWRESLDIVLGSREVSSREIIKSL